MGSFSLSNSAKSDLRGIAKFTEPRWGREQRKHYLKGMDDAFLLLADAPNIGVSCDYVAGGLRKYFYQSHVIYFDISAEKSIRIVRILHKRMDVTRAAFHT